MSRATGQDATGTRIDRYAAARGEQVATVRKRIQRGLLPAYKGADHRWYVLDHVARDGTQDATGDATGQDTRQDATGAVAVNPSARAQLEAIRDEWLAPLIERIATLERENGGLEATTAAKDQVIAELRRRAEVAEAELGAARVALDMTVAGQAEALVEAATLRGQLSAATPAQDATTGADSTPQSSAPPAPAEGLWGRVRRWWSES